MSKKRKDKPLTVARRLSGSAATSFLESTCREEGLVDHDAVALPTLTFLSGDALGKEIPLVRAQLTLGRGEESDILIMDPLVSRRHVRLSTRVLVGRNLQRRPKVLLEDLGSKNGTLVNYRHVRKAVLHPGDKISLGGVILKFEYRDMADQNFYEQLHRLANFDHLTGIYNKASITRILSEEAHKTQRYSRRLSVLLLDLDHFKKVNDTHGHHCGDRVLRAAGATLRRTIRRQDSAGRFGGEEFLIVLPETGLQGALRVAERIRKAIENTAGKESGIGSTVTVSIGAASSAASPADAARLLEFADAALYKAKAEGRNRVEIWKQPAAPPVPQR